MGFYDFEIVGGNIRRTADEEQSDIGLFDQFVISYQTYIIDQSS